MIPVLLLAAALQDQASGATVSAPPAVQERPPLLAQLTVAPTYADSNRLAISPSIDGKFDNEEWDPLLMADGSQTFFQWEPHKVHVAGQMTVGTDALVSLDAKGDGWFVGEDNIEVRVTWNGTSAEFKVRRMANVGTTGPTWLDATDFQAAMKTAASGDSSQWRFELTVEDPGFGFLPEGPGQRIGIRVDGSPVLQPLLDPYLPRVVPLIQTVHTRGTTLPTGLKWQTRDAGRSVMPGEDLRIRIGFDGVDGLTLKRVELRTEGLGREYTVSTGIPFPGFDRRFRAFVDYETRVAPNAPIGWRVMRATATDSQDQPTILQASYQIASPVSFEWIPRTVSASEEKQDVRIACHIRSNTGRRVDGVFQVEPPNSWIVKSGNNKSFTLFNRGGKRQVFELEVPGGFRGTVPLKLRARIGALDAERIVWLIVN